MRHIFDVFRNIICKVLRKVQETLYKVNIKWRSVIQVIILRDFMILINDIEGIISPIFDISYYFLFTPKFYSFDVITFTLNFNRVFLHFDESYK